MLPPLPRAPSVFWTLEGARMGYSVILVHVDAGRDADARIRLASGLAKAWGATLIGAAASAMESMGGGDIAGGEAGSDGADFVGGEDSDKPQVDEIAAWLARLEEHFRQSAGHEAMEWRAAIGLPTEFVIRQARAADLLIIGPDRTGDSYRSVDPSSVVVAAGRPVLLVPSGIDSLRPRRILVAWKNTKEARRAVWDALPFLHGSQEVVAVHVAEPEWRFDTPSDLDDVARYLAHHQIKATSRVEKQSKSSVAAEIIRLAEEHAADLVVAGGYGRSRLGEFIFGGVTRELLAMTPLCCLLSH
jgi:nucleotide-binding universal stress UspA family protein